MTIDLLQGFAKVIGVGVPGHASHARPLRAVARKNIGDRQFGTQRLTPLEIGRFLALRKALQMVAVVNFGRCFAPRTMRRCGSGSRKCAAEPMKSLTRSLIGRPMLQVACARRPRGCRTCALTRGEGRLPETNVSRMRDAYGRGPRRAQEMTWCLCSTEAERSSHRRATGLGKHGERPIAINDPEIEFRRMGYRDSGDFLMQSCGQGLHGSEPEIDFNTPARPDAGSKCPIFDFTGANRQEDESGRWASAFPSASLSIGSPTFVPVPCASTNARSLGSIPKYSVDPAPGERRCDWRADGGRQPGGPPVLASPGSRRSWRGFDFERLFWPPGTEAQDEDDSAPSART